MSNIWFTSDTHYGHKNIVRGTSDWDDKSRCRDFDTIEEHDNVLVDNINKYVKENDVLYHLGDWSFGGIDNIKEFRERINCKNIHLILGNHDHHIERNTDNLQSLFSSVKHYNEIKHGGATFILSHYAMRVWNKSHKGSIMLYGHSHGTLDAKPHLYSPILNPTWIGDNYFIKNFKTMDVGIDTKFEFTPYHLNDILLIMREKEVILNIDHHDETTN
jgi:calcineurin-like phosphoesterase family protein